MKIRVWVRIREDKLARLHFLLQPKFDGECAQDIDFAGHVSDVMWSLFLCVDAVQKLDVDERWQQYWHDYGEQLVRNDWVQKYHEYIDDSYHSATELVDTEAAAMLARQSSVNTDSLRNDNELSESSKNEVESPMSAVNDPPCCVDATNFEHSPSVDCENDVEGDERLIGGSRNAANISDAENDSLAATDGVSNDRVIAADGDKVSDGDPEQSSWDCLWQQHYTDTYWYYYECFMYEERQMQQADSYTAQPANDVQQLAMEAYHLHDEVLPSSQSTFVEPLDVVECLLSELLLSVVDSVDHPCPVDGNDRKQRKKKRKQNGRGLFDILHLSLSC